ncbi:MAG: hypothetical protein ACLFUS_15805, partial [Candidatus Sumerlaeia bacterium]
VNVYTGNPVQNNFAGRMPAIPFCQQDAGDTFLPAGCGRYLFAGKMPAIPFCRQDAGGTLKIRLRQLAGYLIKGFGYRGISGFCR